VKKLFILLALMVLVLQASWADNIGIAADPSRLGVGARSLGMGRAYLGLADDTGSIFLNPAGLGTLPSFTGTSMTGKFINEIDFYTCGFTVPFGNGSLGGGFVGTGISADLQAGTLEVVGDQFFLIPSTNEVNTFHFNDNVFLLSYGQPVKYWLNHDWFKYLYFGGNLKFFFVDLTGTGITNGDARGNEVDLALLYKPLDFYSLGVNLQNILPFSWGGKLAYSSGNQESFPAVIKLGSRFHLLGKKRALRTHQHELNLMIDCDMNLQNVPALFHTGLEWQPHPLLTLRTGIDQELVGTSYDSLTPYSNYTAGISLYYADFRFDYGYHQYQNFKDNDTHYFSLSYLPEVKEKLKVFNPTDKSVVYREILPLNGVVLDRKIKKVTVSEVNTAFGRDGKFNREIFPKLGKNKVVVDGLDGDDSSLVTIPLRLLRLPSFVDVTDGYWAKQSIETLALFEVIGGYPDGTFKPEGRITRAEMATLLMRVRLASEESRIPPMKKEFFKDVSLRHWAAWHIYKAVYTKVVKGYPGKIFKPNGQITRAEGVATIVRFAQLSLTGTNEVPFPDVPGRHWAVKEINAAKAAGLLDYLEGKKFEPNMALTRGEVAEMLARTPGLKAKIGDLFNWESY
jgi:hypothetical protein